MDHTAAVSYTHLDVYKRQVFIRTDVSSPSQVRSMVDEVMKRFGKIDVLICNAGIHAGGKFWEETPDTWQKMFEVNVMGVVYCCQAVVPIMIKQGKGKIINVSSKAAIVGEPLHAAYSSSKGAVLSLIRAMASELGQYGIRVNGLCPGTTPVSYTHLDVYKRQGAYLPACISI